MSATKRIGAGLALVGILCGCSNDDKDNINQPDPALVARGNYLVHHVGLCGECHTPRDLNGDPIPGQFLAGTDLFADLDPAVDSVGAIPTPNLTPHATGLASWTDAEIRSAIVDGRDENGAALFPIMPYWVFHNMTSGDVDAVVAYLRSVPAVDHAVPERQPLPFPFTTPAQPIPAASVPNTTLPPTDANFLSAQRGRYLAGLAGVCIDCHSPESGGAVPAALDSLFAGGRAFGPSVFSANITPHATGIAAYTAEEIQRLLLTGVDEDSMQVCPPMPVGPGSPYSGLTAQDALDIGRYLTTIPGIAHTVPDCQPFEVAP